VAVEAEYRQRAGALTAMTPPEPAERIAILCSKIFRALLVRTLLVRALLVTVRTCGSRPWPDGEKG
jgi:hypothetical protein